MRQTNLRLLSNEEARPHKVIRPAPGQRNASGPSNGCSLDGWARRAACVQERARRSPSHGEPLADALDDLEWLVTTDARALLEARPGSELAVAGVVVALSERSSGCAGQCRGIAALRGPMGTISVRVDSVLYPRVEGVLRSGAPLWVRGRVPLDRHSGTPRLDAEEIAPLEQALAERASRVIVVLRDWVRGVPSHLYGLESLLRAHPGSTPLCLVVETGPGPLALLEAGPSFTLRASLALRHAVERLLGPGSVIYV